MLASHRAGRVNPDALRVVGGDELWAQVSAPRLDLDLLRSAVKRGLVTEQAVDQCREEGSDALLHRRPGKQQG